VCDRDDSGAATWPGRGRSLRLATDHGARRDALEPLMRLVLDVAAMVALLRSRSSGAGEFRCGAAAER
jgi:hypothetical protein